MNWGNAWKEIKGVKVCREGWKQKVLLILLVFQIVQSVHSDCTKIWRFVLCETGSARPPPLSLIIPSHRPKVHIAYTLSIFSLYKNLKVVLCVTGSAHVPYPPLSYHTFPPPLKLKIFCPSNCYDLCWKYHLMTSILRLIWSWVPHTYKTVLKLEVIELKYNLLSF